LPIAPPQGGDPLTGGEDNNLGFYPPAQALVVKAPSRITGRFRPPYPAGPGGGGPPLQIMRGDDANPRDIVFVPADKGKVLGERGKRPEGLDAKVVWQEALVKSQAGDPSLIIAVADFLGLQGKWEDCAEFLKAELRLGIVVKPWVYETLAIALKESGGSIEEIERAEISVVDLQPGNATGFLRASQAMADHKHYDRAVAFCRQASILEPNTATPYAEALLYAEYGGDAKAMEWAAGGLLKQDWPSQNKELQLKAQQKLESLAKSLKEKSKVEEAKRLTDTVNQQRRRDLVVKASFQGEASIDLKVKEPTGGVCWSLNRQTIGGGTFSGDTVGDLNNQSYTAAQAFSGDYEVTVERVWGHPLSDKVQLRIIRNQGTNDESEQLETVDFNKAKRGPVKFKLENGRRTETAYVPPASTQAVRETVADPLAAANVMDQLRDLASPELFGSNAGFRCSAGSSVPYDVLPSSAGASAKAAAPSPDDRVVYQNKVASFMKQSMDVTAQTVLSGDRRSVRLSMEPQFTPASVSGTQPVVTSSVIPGGGKQP
jgi:tetratricopeptide (TPR) repeat protein